MLIETFKTFITEATRSPKDEEEKSLYSFMEELDSVVAHIKVEDIGINTKTNSKTIYIDKYLNGAQRPAYVASATDHIKNYKEYTLAKVPSGRATKEFAFISPDSGRTVHVKCRPQGGFKSDGDPNELFAAALMLLPKIETPGDDVEMDAIIDEVKKLVNSGKVIGHTSGQVAGMDKNYGKLCSAISAAQSIPSKYSKADKVYLTGQAWDKDVKQFQRTKYGMKDFNSSDFIIKKGDNYLGVSLKEKKLATTADPTLINKSFASMLTAFATQADAKFGNLKDKLEEQIAIFYSAVIIRNYKKLNKQTQEELKSISKLSLKKQMEFLVGSGKKRPWKQYVKALDNKIINASLVSQKSVLAKMDKILLSNSDLFAESLVQLIFKAELKDLQKVNFDFALVTGIGQYLKKGPQISKGEYKDINTMSSVLENIFSSGSAKLIKNPKMKQAFEPGATAANLNYHLIVGTTPIVEIQLRYKGNFGSAPSFQAGMTKEFKGLF
ncbi:MAG TPA: hypothetical protein DHV22_05000 [Xanthomarina gelatinilytica]|uniref:Uncharacterized protein n=1 Tax=Xanthomarina gelatinilytica TaxID=1137281 RepID=A0A3D6BP25_9FLAO|nr:hypothetical protein [Xanthomarina gelatinilytica]